MVFTWFNRYHLYTHLQTKDCQSKVHYNPMRLLGDYRNLATREEISQYQNNIMNKLRLFLLLQHFGMNKIKYVVKSLQ